MKRSASFLAGLFLLTIALASTATAAGSAREILSKEAPNASAWALAGLDETVPPDIRRNLTYLREDLLDEGSSASQTNAASYKLGCTLCDALIAALDEREQARVRAGYRAAQADNNTKVTSPDLEIRGSALYRWPQYAREQNQRSEIQRQQNNQTALAKQVVLGEWATHAAMLRRNLDDLYRRYREALRQHTNFQARTASPQEPVIEKSMVATPAPVVPAATNTGGAAITISCSDAVRVMPLVAGNPTYYNSPKSPTEIIESVSPELSGLQYVSPPMGAGGWYEVRVNQSAVLYVFGCRNKHPDQDAAEEISKWEKATGAIQASGLNFSFRRKVTAGETIKLKAFHLLLAAKSIELARDAKSEPATQPTATVPTPAVVAPWPAVQAGEAWTNSLGMIFVPVPGTKVQFSIWDTRVQDYQAFVTATGREWEKPNFKQGPTHPAVMVSWDDAKAFCAWLTEKERRAGTLNAAQEYRLPTDLEWSTAVGLQNETGSTPQERSRKRKNVFPWGTQWPPPRGAGNYAPSLGVDDFDYTSPVGSFAANRFGLYDMSGNVWQLCEDFYNGQSGVFHSCRGGCWYTDSLRDLLSSQRRQAHTNGPHNGLGFRCVLAGGGASAPR